MKHNPGSYIALHQFASVIFILLSIVYIGMVVNVMMKTAQDTALAGGIPLHILLTVQKSKSAYC